MLEPVLEPINKKLHGTLVFPAMPNRSDDSDGLVAEFAGDDWEQFLDMGHKLGVRLVYVGETRLDDDLTDGYLMELDEQDADGDVEGSQPEPANVRLDPNR